MPQLAQFFGWLDSPLELLSTPHLHSSKAYSHTLRNRVGTYQCEIKKQQPKAPLLMEKRAAGHDEGSTEKSEPD